MTYVKATFRGLDGRKIFVKTVRRAVTRGRPGVRIPQPGIRDQKSPRLSGGCLGVWGLCPYFVQLFLYPE